MASRTWSESKQRWKRVILQGAWVRVRWTVADEERHEVDREAIKRALAGVADVQLEGRIVPIVRSRAAGISRCASLGAKVRAWAAVTGAKAEPLLADLERMSHQSSEQIAADVLSRSSEAEMTGRNTPPLGPEVGTSEARPIATDCAQPRWDCFELGRATTTYSTSGMATMTVVPLLCAGLQFDLAAQLDDQCLHDRQTKAEAVLSVCRLGCPEEGFEHTVLNFLRDSDARVRDHDEQFACTLVRCAHVRGNGDFTRTRVLDGIADEVLHDLAHLAEIDPQFDVLRRDPDLQALRVGGRRVEVGDVADQDRQRCLFQPIVRSPGLAARVVGDPLHLVGHQVGGGSKPAQRQVKLRNLGKPVLQELDIRHDDLGGSPDFMPDLGHEELLAFRRSDFGRSSGGSGLDQHGLLPLDRLVPQPVRDPVDSKEPARRPSHLIRNSDHRHAIDREKERRHP